MLRPKASHLVERAAERLLRSGALEDSAAQLMEPTETTPAGLEPKAETVLPQTVTMPAGPPPAAPAGAAPMRSNSVTALAEPPIYPLPRQPAASTSRESGA